MSFHSAAFALIFFPAVLAAFSWASRRMPALAAPLLLGASLVFYAVSDLSSLPLLLLSIIANYWISGAILKSANHRRAWVALGVMVNLLPLIWWKYGAAAPPSGDSGFLAVAGIPLGLSFYTFQNLTCLFDIQKPQAVRLSFFRHALFAGFFAQIYSGPISRYRDMAPQIRDLGLTPVSAVTILGGISLFLVGLAKKLVFADSIGNLVDAIHAFVAAGKTPTFLEAWIAAWGFMLQLYFDFSGYSDMAIGVAICFGLALPANFNSPFKAVSASEFVDRWHMSLAACVREYMYQPLFQWVRKLPLGSAQGRRIAAWIVATIISMGVIGAWHGSQITFLLGGIIGGVLLVAFQLPGLLTVARPPVAASWPGWRRLRRLAGRILLLGTLTALTLLNRVDSLDGALVILRAMGDLTSVSVSAQLAAILPGAVAPFLHYNGYLPNMAYYWKPDAVLMLLGSIAVFTMPSSMQIFGRLPVQAGSAAPPTWRPTVAWGIAIGLVAVCAIVFGQNAGHSGFIYARF